MLTIDTNIIIYYLANETGVAAAMEGWRREKRTLFISTITELELLSHASLAPEHIKIIEDVITTFTIIPVDSQIARIAAELRRHYRILTPDSAIAATALFTHSSLVTRDVEHFSKISELPLEKI